MRMPWLKRLPNSLAFKIVLFLTLALLPIGLIAFQQSKIVSFEAQQRLQLSMIAWTDLAAADEREVIQRAFGAAEALSVILPAIKNDPDLCYSVLTDYLERAARFSLIGFPDRNGKMTCSSADKVFDFSKNPIFEKVKANPEPFVEIRTRGRVSDTSVILVVQPVFKEDIFDGYIVVSIPHESLSLDFDTELAVKPLELIVFNDDGAILSSSVDLDTADERIPQGRSLKSLARSGSVAFDEFGREDRNRIYTSTPILNDRVYALSIWNRNSDFLLPANLRFTASIFPLLMWMASILVAYMALHGLVLRHIKRLRLQMAQFAENRQMPRDTDVLKTRAPREFQDMETDFIYMAESLLQDEAMMEQAVREKNVLLKEVHHRVKNNLQLISSIMNMHMREAVSAESKSVLRRLQDRILGLATVHRSLYQTDNLDNLNAGDMLADVVGQMMSVGLPPGSGTQVIKDIENITLYPDQAVPLSLMASEALTNALKYLGIPEKEAPWIKVRFADTGKGQAMLSVSNSKGKPVNDLDVTEKTGLGSKLIRSFGIQLGAEITVHEDEATYKIVATFDIADFSPDPLDY